ncbi:MAG: hypothetical protein Q7U57_07375 [Methylovulum sp.]|nr:hypothetical protein [Methylovulum sp.]
MEASLKLRGIKQVDKYREIKWGKEPKNLREVISPNEKINETKEIKEKEEIPRNVKQAVIGIWAMLLYEAILDMALRQSGEINTGNFILSLIINGFLCMLPYKISKRSNPARYTYTIINIAILLFGIGEIDKLKISWTKSIIEMSIQFIIIYKLFTREASEWFDKTNQR